MKYLLFFILIFQLNVGSGQELHHKAEDLPCLNKQYNLFVHLVYDELRNTEDRERVEAAIEVVNDYFSPICISFSICEIDTFENYNFNGLKPNWELNSLSAQAIGQKRINLYVITGILVNNRLTSYCLGDVNDLNNANLYVTDLDYISHALGHFFGLEHTFKDEGEELVDGSNCEIKGDGLCDTPADPLNLANYYQYGLNGYIKNCIFIANLTDANGEYYQPDVGNIMSFYNCPCGFTRGQYLKMAKNILSAKNKHW